MRKILIGIIYTVLMTNASGKELAGLILNGVDTIHTHPFGENVKCCLSGDIGFDFVLQKACTTIFSNSSCVNHFTFIINGLYTQYELQVPSGYSVNMNKTNLDSIKLPLHPSSITVSSR